MTKNLGKAEIVVSKVDWRVGGGWGGGIRVLCSRSTARMHKFVKQTCSWQEIDSVRLSSLCEEYCVRHARADIDGTHLER